MQALTQLDRINYINILLMILSGAMAVFLPFELFLFSYAVLGPLHYLTEISWLHDRKYYTIGKYDYLVLLLLTIAITFPVIGPMLNLGKGLSPVSINQLIYFSLAASLVFVFIKKPQYRLIVLLLAFVTVKFSNNIYLMLSVFLPTLIHVFIFTALFVWYGALKSKSKSGYFSFIVMLAFPFILFMIPINTNYSVSEFAFNSYTNFESINFYGLKQFFGLEADSKSLKEIIYYSEKGVLFMRVIAFAYTYHYLNWFSKTEIIQWHRIPRSRLFVILLLWILSILAYTIDYGLGFKCLFFLSFLHVIFEFPLNAISIKGIFYELKRIKILT
jgi:hypothetical protein